LLFQGKRGFGEREKWGFSAAGMVLKVYSFPLENPDPQPEEIVKAMDGNLFRCSAHPRFLSAIQEAGKEMRGRKR
jgi:isoquinoline 1-oxidoreductase alpha subunit